MSQRKCHVYVCTGLLKLDSAAKEGQGLPPLRSGCRTHPRILGPGPAGMGGLYFLSGEALEGQYVRLAS